MRPTNDRIETLIGGRRERIARALGRKLTRPEAPADNTPLDEESREHLLEDGRDLYWNELEWEHLTAEEATAEGPLAPLVFTGVLAYVRGLLLEETMPDALAEAEPRPEVVEQLLRFLARRVLELEEEIAAGGEEPDRLRLELRVTDHLVDLVLYDLHGLSKAERDVVEADRPTPAEASAPGAPARDS